MKITLRHPSIFYFLLTFWLVSCASEDHLLLNNPTSQRQISTVSLNDVLEAQKSDVYDQLTRRYQLQDGDYYGRLEISSFGIVSGFEACFGADSLFESFKRGFGSLLNVENANAFAITLDLKDSYGTSVLTSLPVLTVSREVGDSGGVECKVEGPAIQAAGSGKPLTPFFRMDPRFELQPVFKIRALNSTDVGAVARLLDITNDVLSISGGGGQIVGILGRDKTRNLATTFDSALESALSQSSLDATGGIIKSTFGIEEEVINGYRLNLAKYIGLTDVTRYLDLSMNYVFSVATSTRPPFSYTSNVHTLLSLNAPADNNTYSSIFETLDSNKVPGFNPSQLRSLSPDETSVGIMRTACVSLKSYLGSNLNLSPNDELVIRWAALKQFTDYFDNIYVWQESCLTGGYLIPGRSGESERLEELINGLEIPSTSDLAFKFDVEIKTRVGWLYAELSKHRIHNKPVGEIATLSPDNFQLTIIDEGILRPEDLDKFNRIRDPDNQTAYGPNALDLFINIMGRSFGCITPGNLPIRPRNFEEFYSFAGFALRGNSRTPMVIQWSQPRLVVGATIGNWQTLRAEYDLMNKEWPNMPSTTSCHSLNDNFAIL